MHCCWSFDQRSLAFGGNIASPYKKIFHLNYTWISIDQFTCIIGTFKQSVSITVPNDFFRHVYSYFTFLHSSYVFIFLFPPLLDPPFHFKNIILKDFLALCISSIENFLFKTIALKKLLFSTCSVYFDSLHIVNTNPVLVYLVNIFSNFISCSLTHLTCSFSLQKLQFHEIPFIICWFYFRKSWPISVS